MRRAGLRRCALEGGLQVREEVAEFLVAGRLLAALLGECGRRAFERAAFFLRFAMTLLGLFAFDPVAKNGIIYLTGGTGFVGRALLRWLAEGKSRNWKYERR